MPNKRHIIRDLKRKNKNINLLSEAVSFAATKFDKDLSVREPYEKSPVNDEADTFTLMGNQIRR